MVGLQKSIVQSYFDNYYIMRKSILIASILSIAIIVIYFESSQSSADAFEHWKTKYGVSFDSQQEIYRKLVFEKNVKIIERHNADQTKTYKMGINQFTIYSNEQFAARFLIHIQPNSSNKQVDHTYEPGDDIDWVALGKVSRVGTQGQCGSSWAFSATSVVQSFYKIKGEDIDNLSVQQLVDCSFLEGSGGCTGGWPPHGLSYIQKKGVVYQYDYPYVAKDQNCQIHGGPIKIRESNLYFSCSTMREQIKRGPITLSVAANQWVSYSSGVFDNCHSSTNHAALLVGIVDGAWKVKNSWGTSWGEGGYIRLAPGNTCDVCSAGFQPIN